MEVMAFTTVGSRALRMFPQPYRNEYSPRAAVMLLSMRKF